MSEQLQNWLINQAQHVEVLEEKIKLERRLNKDLHKLQDFLQNNPELSKHRYGEPIPLIAVDAMEILKKENVELKVKLQKAHEHIGREIK